MGDSLESLDEILKTNLRETEGFMGRKRRTGDEWHIKSQKSKS